MLEVTFEETFPGKMAVCEGWLPRLPSRGGIPALEAHVSTQKFQELDFVKTQMTVFAALDNNFKDAKYERDEKHVKRNLVRLDDASNVTKLKQRIAIDLHNASKRVWYSCHCHESRWAPDTKARWQARGSNHRANRYMGISANCTTGPCIVVPIVIRVPT